MAADDVGPMTAFWAIKSADGTPMAEPARFALARGTVRHVGEAVAAIIAESADQARDAAELVEVDYEPLPSVIDAKAAMHDNAPLLHECAPSNLCFRFARGDEATVGKAFAGAAHIVRLDLINNRLIGAAIEPRAVIADGSAGSKLTLYCATQVPHLIRRAVGEQLKLPQTAIRLVAPDVVAEAAADVGRDEPDRGLRQVELLADGAADEMRDLRGAVERQLVGLRCRRPTAPAARSPRRSGDC